MVGRRYADDQRRPRRMRDLRSTFPLRLMVEEDRNEGSQEAGDQFSRPWSEQARKLGNLGVEGEVEEKKVMRASGSGRREVGVREIPPVQTQYFNLYGQDQVGAEG